jgi:hypothetical protein
VQDHSAGAEGDGPLLTIEGIAMFSGLSVDTRDADAWEVARPA